MTAHAFKASGVVLDSAYHLLRGLTGKKVKLTEEAKAIFDSIEKKLVKVAYKYKLSDPEGEAKSWYARLVEILGGFDSGRYKKEITSASGERIVVTENSCTDDIREFKKNLVNYLVMSFKNELSRSSNRSSKTTLLVLEDEDDGTSSAKSGGQRFSIDSGSGPEDAYNDVLSGITFDDLIDLIKRDLAKTSKNITTAPAQINVWFLKAILAHYEEVRAITGDFPISRKYEADDSSFFVSTIREGKLEGVRRHFESLVKNENKLTVSILAGKILESKNNYALSQKLCRYFKTVPSRLRKIKTQANSK